jgi:hypothetical protein
MNVRVCVRCYNMTHKHDQTHRHKVLVKTGYYEEPLPEPT